MPGFGFGISRGAVLMPETDEREKYARKTRYEQKGLW